MALAQTKKGGPYPKSEQRKRREEVYKLHFDYGYSARKIAEFLNINRGTINRDINNCFADVFQKWDREDPRLFVMNEIERLEIQRTRQRKYLDKVESDKERDKIEKFIFMITIQIVNIQIKLIEAKRNSHNFAINTINEWYEKKKSKNRVISSDTILEVSHKAHDKIYRIYKEDWKHNS